MIRPGLDSDAAGFIALIGACWAEYSGCIMDMDRENAELLALASYFREAGGTLWTAERDGRIVGMVGTRPAEPGHGTWEVCKVYVDSDARGTGLAVDLLRMAEAHARAQGAARMVLWSDTRFARAHRFYERHGYIREGGIRALGDLSNSLEFGYAKPLSGVLVRRLDTAAAASAARALSRILVDCVADGASVSFLPPLDPAVAEAFYRRAATDIAAGRRVLLAAWVDGELAGSVMLDLATPPNQPHRADVQKMLVSPALRRRGVARRLLAALEEEARVARRWLLTLDTRSGDSAEKLYRAQGWQDVGRIPAYALNPDGSYCDTQVFYKTLPRL